MWSAPIHDPSFVKKMLESLDATEFGTKPRIKAILTAILKVKK